MTEADRGTRGAITIRASYRTLQAARLASVVGAITGVAIGLALVIASGPLWVDVVGGLLVAWTVCLSLVEILFVLPAAVRNFSICVTGSEIIVRKGALLRRIDRIPMSKVTGVRTRTGPILRRFGLSSCTILTASAEVSALPVDESQARLLSTGHRAS